MDKFTPNLTVKIDSSTSIKTDTREPLETRAGDGIISISVDVLG